MSTNFCIGCGAPLENNQNFTAKKCSYCGLDNSYVNPRRENKTFFQRFFAFKRTIVPKKNNKLDKNILLLFIASRASLLVLINS